MIGKENITKITKHAVRRGQGRFDITSMHPTREWLTGISVTTILFLLLGAYAGYSFINQSDKLEEQVSAKSEMLEYKQEKARTVLEFYRTRAQLFEKLRGTSQTTSSVLNAGGAAPAASLPVSQLADEETRP